VGCRFRQWVLSSARLKKASCRTRLHLIQSGQQVTRKKGEKDICSVEGVVCANVLVALTLFPGERRI
jgi:hypothetical protein